MQLVELTAFEPEADGGRAPLIGSDAAISVLAGKKKLSCFSKAVIANAGLSSSYFNCKTLGPVAQGLHFFSLPRSVKLMSLDIRS